MRDFLSILVVDTDPSIYRGLQQLLPDGDFELTSSESAEQAVELLAQGPFDVVITDARLVAPDGARLPQWLTSAYAGTAVVASYDKTYDAPEVLRCGARDFLHKPLEGRDAVVAVVSRSVQRVRDAGGADPNGEELHSHLENYRASFEACADGILIVGHDGEIMYANGHAYRYLGADPKSFTRWPFPYPVDRPQLYEIKINLPSKVKGIGEMRITQIRWHGMICGAVFIHNITEYKEEETSLREAVDLAQKSDQSKTEFLEQASFTIRTVMQGIIGMIELFEGTQLTREQATFLAAIEGSAKTLRQLINEIFDFAGVGCGDLDREVLSLDLPKTEAQEVRMNPAFHPNVLVVEDDLTNRQVVSGLLAKLGCIVDVAEDGDAAVEAAGNKSFDLILMDCWLPEKNGFEATELIRKQKGTGRHIPIVAITADKRSGVQQRCFDAGMDDVLLKPVSGPLLSKTLEKWLEFTGPSYSD